MVKQNRFAEAIALQDACNPSGVAHTLLEMFRECRDTSEKRSDPAIRITVAKLADLCGLDYQWPADAYAECQERATP